MPHSGPARSVFFVSDGTGITAETMGHSVLTQFDQVRYRLVRMPFIDDAAKARDVVTRINSAAIEEGVRPIVFTTLARTDVRSELQQAQALILDLFAPFVAPLEAELGLKSSQTVGGFHDMGDTDAYTNRIDAINFTLAHDDGQTEKGLAEADVILLGVSRSGKTPTTLYLAMQFGLRAANYPLIPEDFERDCLPGSLTKHRSKLFGLTIDPQRLAQIRHERRPNSKYASLENCRYEVEAAERLMKRESVRWLSSTTKSIEEIAATIIAESNFDRRTY
jgi:[pyruvate, water dikinase]-phosphate phosphotransferase / [pyruvate, water dikinase] kinase